MGLPSKLKNFNLAVNGDSYAGIASEVELPKLTLKTEAFRNAGMLSELDADMGLEKMEMTSKFGGLVVGVLRTFGIFGLAGVGMRFNGAYQEDGAGTVTPAELIVRGKHTEIDPGTAKVGDNTEWSVKSTLSYLRWTVRGRTEVEIDVINNLFIIDGVDRMLPIREALVL